MVSLFIANKLQFISNECALDVSVISKKERKSILKSFSGKKRFKNVTLQILNFMSVS